MTFFDAIILGAVEGLTEFLPISSTGHLILADYWLGLTPSNFASSFNIAIQLGAILAVVWLYAGRLFRPGRNKRLLAQVLVAFLPTALVGLVFYRPVKLYLLGNVAVTLGALFLGGAALLGLEWWLRRRERRHQGPPLHGLESLTYGRAALVGLAQSLAIIPGVSRAAATIGGGLLLGLRREAIVEFSFLLAIPTMLAATLLDLWRSAAGFSGGDWGRLLVGFLVSFAVALLAVRWLLRYIRAHDFTFFGYYRILLALIFWLIIW